MQLSRTLMYADTTKFTELQPGSFIYELPGALDPGLCLDIVQRFEACTHHQYEGRIGQTGGTHPDIKRSTDLRVSGRPEWRDVDQELFGSLAMALNALSAAHPFFTSNSFRDMGYNLQRTRPGEFYHWHVDSGPGEFSQRQLVAIWYLNDVDGPGGETEFHFQNVLVKPEQGKLILFPPFWTHAHRGVTPRNATKYIATTWVCFSPEAADSVHC